MYHLSQFARATPDKVAVHFLESGKAFTFAQLERQANRAANALLSLGLKQHDCIALCLENSPELLFLTLGAQRIGLYYTLMSTRLSAADSAYIVKDSQARIAITTSSMESWQARFATASEDPPPVLAPGREMLYSSGTTGRPKGVRKPPFEGSFDDVDNRSACRAARIAWSSPAWRCAGLT